jgi:RimJ/RimL family protein N-acetyltransferase
VISLETDWLVIRNFSPDDWQELQELAIRYQASEWAKYDHPWPTSTEKVKGMAEWLATRNDYLAVTVKATNKLIGLIAIDQREDQQKRVHNLGYVFHPDYSGKGYATQGCRAAMGYLFEELAADGILTGTHPDNEPSVRLLKRLGLRETRDGEFTISREEWLALGHKAE